ncbi:MAG: hypothetical protein AAGB93_18010, partial [Planctomycetota bacterium]
MRVDVVVVHVRRYRFGHEKHFVPPLTGIHLAALTPPRPPGGGGPPPGEDRRQPPDRGHRARDR